MALPILYSFRRCPFAIRARLAIAAAGIQCELREVVLRDKPAAMCALSKKSVPTVPILEVDGRVIEESFDIMLWALEQNDPDGWLDVDRRACFDLVAENDGAFKLALDQTKYPDRFDDGEADGARERAGVFLATLEARLTRHAQLFGDRVSLGDVAVLPFVRQFAGIDREAFDAEPFEALRRWLDAHLGHTRFRAVMEKYDKWTPGQAPVRFPTSS